MKSLKRFFLACLVCLIAYMCVIGFSSCDKNVDVSDFYAVHILQETDIESENIVACTDTTEESEESCGFKHDFVDGVCQKCGVNEIVFWVVVVIIVILLLPLILIILLLSLIFGLVGTVAGSIMVLILEIANFFVG